VEDIETCLLCGTKGVPLYEGMRDRLFDAPGVWSHLRCPQDGLVWLSPRPVIEDISKVYANYYTHDIAKDRQSFLASLKRRVEESLVKTEFGYEMPSGQQGFGLMGRVLALLPMAKEIAGSSVMWLTERRNGKLLDVGCGNGHFLALMQNLGWEISGVEPDARAARIARERLGGAIITGRLEDADFARDFFDALTVHDVIEHTHDPMGLLREAFRILKVGAKLVLTTPNIDSLGHQLFRKSWHGLDPPRHLYIFSPRTLRICADQIGYRVEILRTTARSAWERWYASRLIHRDGAIPGGFPKFLSRRLRLEGLAFQMFQHMLLRLKRDVGEGILLIASKRDRR